MRNLLLLAVGCVTLAGCSFFGIRSGTEQVSYTVVETIAPSVEIRSYGSRLAAETVMDAADEDDGRNAAFRVLFDYITGANRPQAEIAMTAPVETEARGGGDDAAKIAMTAPVETNDAGDGRIAMRFFLPAAYTAETAPAPTDPRVRIVEIPGQTIAVLRFTGARDEAHVADQRAHLLQALEDSAWRPVAEPVALFYDPPWTLPFLRRNEVAATVTAK